MTHELFTPDIIHLMYMTNMGYIFFLPFSDVDVHNSTYQVADGSVILQADDEKYQDTDDSLSESESGDQTEQTERYM